MSAGTPHGLAPRLITLPSTDRLFGRFVAETLTAFGRPSLRRLQLHLRALYPRVVIHASEVASETAPTWYAFRDGRVGHPPFGPDWSEADVAHVLIDRRGRIVEADEAACSMFGLPCPDERGSALQEHGLPGTADDIARLIGIAFDLGEGESVLRLEAMKGERREVAFRSWRRGDLLAIGFLAIPDLPSRQEFAPIIFPAWDGVLIAHVERLVRGLAPGPTDDRIRLLERRLRERFPHAIVRERPGIVGFGPTTVVLFVYRDGERSPYGEGPAWWKDPALPRIVTEDERFVEANEAAATLYGLPVGELLASPVGRFRDPVVGDDANWLRDILERVGELHTTATLVRADGTPVAVEYHVTRHGAGPGRDVTVFRPFERPASPGEDRPVERKPDAVLAEWREAERRRDALPPGPEREAADVRVAELREEYRRVFVAHRDGSRANAPRGQ